MLSRCVRRSLPLLFVSAIACSQGAQQSSGSAVISGGTVGAQGALKVGPAGGAQVTSDASGSFVLALPAGISSLRFAGAGLDATLAIAPTLDGESRSMTVSIANGIVTELLERSATHWRAPIDAVYSDSIVVAGRTVHLTSATTLTLDGSAATLADLRDGDEAEIEGAILPDGSVLARSISAESHADDGGCTPDDGGEAQDGGGFGPPPPPPGWDGGNWPPPGFDGGWGPPPPPHDDGGEPGDGGFGPPPPPPGWDGGWPFPPPPGSDGGFGPPPEDGGEAHDGGHDHDGGEPADAGEPSDAGEGHDGGEPHDGGVTHHDDDDTGHRCRPPRPPPPDGGTGDADGGSAPQPGDLNFLGTIDSVSGSVLDVSGIAVDVTATTIIVSAGQPVTTAALTVGARVRVDGTLQSDHSVAARTIEVLHADAPPVILVYGPIATLDATAGSFVIGQTTITTNAQTHFPTAGGFGDLTAGEEVQVGAQLQADGSLLALAIEAAHR